MVEPQKIHIGVTALNTFFVWVGCCVAWGGVLFKSNGAKAYYNRAVSGGVTTYWSEVDSIPEYNDCKHASRAWATFFSFIFILLTAQIVLFYMRAKPHVGLIGSLNSWEKIAKYELVIAGVNTFMWFLCLCIFGGGCIDKIKKMPGADVESTGFVYIVLCFLWYIGIIVLLVYKRKHPYLSTWTGMPPTETGTAGYSDANSGAYHPPPREGQPTIGGVPHEGMMAVGVPVHQQQVMYPPPGGAMAAPQGGMYAPVPNDSMKASLIQGGISSDSARINVTVTPDQAAAAAGYAAAAAHQGFQMSHNTTGDFHTEPIA